MSALTLYGLKACDTCAKALKALAAAGRAPAFVDIRAEADLVALVPGWLDAVGAKALVNRASTTWRALDEAQKASAEVDPAPLLMDHPTLIKRPVIVLGATVLTGWTPATRSALNLA